MMIFLLILAAAVSGGTIGFSLAGKSPSQELGKIAQVKDAALTALHEAVMNREHAAAQIYADIVTFL